MGENECVEECVCEREGEREGEEKDPQEVPLMYYYSVYLPRLPNDISMKICSLNYGHLMMERLSAMSWNASYCAPLLSLSEYH